MNEFTLLAVLLVGHIVGDFYLQPSAWVKQRLSHHYRSQELYFHAAVHGVITLCVFVLLTKNTVIMCLLYSLLVLFSHLLIDLFKSYSKQSVFTFLLDQLAHLLVLLIIWALATSQLQQLWSLLTIKNVSYQQATIAIGYLLVLKPSSIIITLLLKPWSEKLKQPSLANIEQATQSNYQQQSTDSDLQSAGKGIGYLERLLILTFILLNQFSAIGFLLAAKSVFRFGDLSRDKDKKMTEYVMLGTLTSFTITILVGLVVTGIASQLPIGK